MPRRPALMDRLPRRLKRHLGALWGLAALGPAMADSTVVFNEIHYHPTDPGARFEWVELHNQMAVNMDLSGWSLSGGIDYRFAEGTVLPGGAQLVVAADPSSLRSLGVTNVVGPFEGRLSNSGERLELRNNNQRRMDVIAYGTDGEWPVVPDGHGPSLAKREETLATGPAVHWRPSAQPGGTPGQPNFPSLDIANLAP
ncbi:MAG: lamin tail domain-containing protein, partial [Verrucomicrobiota bacterium]